MNAGGARLPALRYAACGLPGSAVPPSRLQQLSARRRALVAESDALRARMLWSSARMRDSLGVAALGASAARALARHPPLMLAGAAALLVVGPRRVLRVGLAAVSIWSLLGQVGRLAVAFSRAARRR